MIWNYDHFSKCNIKSSKNFTVLDNSYLFKNSEKKSCNLLGELQILKKKHVAKQILQKFISMKKSKWPQRAHLWFSLLSLLVHLIMIACESI
jgi:hypothetical protein